MKQHSNNSPSRSLKGSNCKTRKRLGWGWIEVPKNKPLSLEEIVYRNPRRHKPKGKNKLPKIRQLRGHSNSPGVSTMYTRTDKHVWAYGRSRPI